MTVASAAPLKPMPTVKMRTGSMTRFSTPARRMPAAGVFASRADWHAPAGSSSGHAEGSAALPEGLSPDDPLAKQLLAEMMDELGMGKQKAERPKRAEHKFQKKSKVKGRIKNKGYGEDHSAGGDGFRMGKKGGMMPAHVQATVRSAITDE